MAKKREDYINDLKALDVENNIVIKDDHNVNDIKLFIELLTLRGERSELLAVQEELKAKLHSVEKEKDSLSTSIEELKEKLANEEETTAVLSASIEELNEELAAAQSGKANIVTVSVGNQKMQIVHPVKLQGKSYSVKQIAADTEIIKQLVSKNSTAVVVVGKGGK